MEEKFAIDEYSGEMVSLYGIPGVFNVRSYFYENVQYERDCSYNFFSLRCFPKRKFIMLDIRDAYKMRLEKPIFLLNTFEILRNNRSDLIGRRVGDLFCNNEINRKSFDVLDKRDDLLMIIRALSSRNKELFMDDDKTLRFLFGYLTNRPSFNSETVFMGYCPNIDNYLKSLKICESSESLPKMQFRGIVNDGSNYRQIDNGKGVEICEDDLGSNKVYIVEYFGDY